MPQTFEVIEKTIGPVVEIEEHIPVWKMPSTFSRDFCKIDNYIKQQSASFTDMPYAHYLEMDWQRELNRGKLGTFMALFTKKWHFFAGIPCTELLPAKDNIQTRNIDTQKYVKGIHLGPYKNCGTTYQALLNWANEQKLSLQNNAFEFYFNDPNEVPKAEIETHIYIPVK